MPTRLIRLDDAPVVAQLLRDNREFLAPWEPVRPELFFTDGGQQEVIRASLEEHEQGLTLPHVIVDDSDRIIGRIALSRISRGPFQSCSLGYWVSAADNGRGVATAAVHDVLRVAFEELGLHRVEAGTVRHNVRSQRVLEHNGFIHFGVAPAYIQIAGTWQDHLLFQVLTDVPD